MPLVIGGGAGEFPATIQQVSNGEPANETVIRRPSIDLENRTLQLKTFVEAQEVIRDAQTGTSGASIGGLQGTFNTDHKHTGADGSAVLDLKQAYDNAATIDAIVAMAAGGSIDFQNSGGTSILKLDEATGKFIGGNNTIGANEIDFGTGGDQVNMDDMVDGSTNAAITLAQETAFDGHIAGSVESGHGGNFQGRAFQPANVTVTGATAVVTGQLAAQTPGGGASVEGIITAAPNNRVIVRSIGFDDFSSGAGDKVFGRITEASGIWTLSFFTVDDSGSEAAFSDFSSQLIQWWVQKTFSFANAPVFNEAFFVPSDEAVAGIDLTNVGTDIIPDGDDTRSLGSAAKKWKELFLSGGSINIGSNGLIRYNESTGQLEFSDNGSSFSTLSSLSSDGGQAAINLTKLQLDIEFGSQKGDSGLQTEYFLDRDEEDPTAETGVLTLMEINGHMREFIEGKDPQQAFQKDRESDFTPKSGLLQAARLPHKFKVIDYWNVGKFSNTVTLGGMHFIESERKWCLVDTDNDRVMLTDEYFTKGFGWWHINGASLLRDCTLNGLDLYVTDQTKSTFGTVEKLTFNSNFTKLNGVASGGDVAPTSTVTGDATFNSGWGITNDGTNLFIAFISADSYAEILLSTFTTFVNLRSLLDFNIIVNGNDIAGIAYDSDADRLWITDGNHIAQCEKDGSAVYAYSTINEYAINQQIAYKDGDLYALIDLKDTIVRIAIKSGEIYEGQIIRVYKNPNAGVNAIRDMARVLNMFGGGNHGYVSINNVNLEVTVYDNDFLEVTSGTPRTTVLTDGSGSGSTAFRGITSDDTSIWVTATGSSNDTIFKFAVTDLDTSLALAGGNVILSDNTAQQPSGITLDPNSNNLVYFHGADTAIFSVDRDAGTGNTPNFGKPRQLGPGIEAHIAFKPGTNGRELYIMAATDFGGHVVADYPMSKNVGNTTSPPYTLKTFHKFLSVYKTPHSCTFDGSGDLVATTNGGRTPIRIMASDSAADVAVTGPGQRRHKYFHLQSNDVQSFPAGAGEQGGFHNRSSCVRYRRKYAASLYSDQRNVLPLDCTFSWGQRGIICIDNESNTEHFMWANSPAAGERGVMGNENLATTLVQVEVCNEIVYIATNGGMYIADLINDTWDFVDGGGGIRRHPDGIAETNRWDSTISGYPATHNSDYKIAGININNIHCRQEDPVRKPEEHQGDLTVYDDSEIHIAVGTSTGNGYIRHFGGVGFIRSASGEFVSYIAEDFSFVEARVFSTGSGHVRAFGDARLISADNSVESWGNQTGRQVIWQGQLLNRWVNDIDIKSIVNNGVHSLYIAIAMGEPNVSDIQGIQIGNVDDFSLELVFQDAATTNAQNDVVWASDSELWSAHFFAGDPRLDHYKRLDYDDGTNSTGLRWTRTIYGKDDYEYGLFDDTSNTPMRRVTYAHNSLGYGSDRNTGMIEFPRQTSQWEQGAYDIDDQSEKAFYIANDSKGIQAPSGNIPTRVIHASVNDDARLSTDPDNGEPIVFTNGDANNWTINASNAVRLGNDAADVLGQASGTQPKIDITTPASTLRSYLYWERGSNKGKVDITGPDFTDYEANTYSASGVINEITCVNFTSAGVHAIIATCKVDQDGDSAGRNIRFLGAVHVIDGAVPRANPTLTYSLSNDQDKATSHFTDLGQVEGLDVKILGQQLFSGDNVLVAFQLPPDNLGATVDSIEVAAVLQISGVDYTFDTPVNGRITVTFTNPPAAGASNIEVNFIRQGEKGKMRIEAAYGAGTTGLEELYVNDIGIYAKKLP